MADQIFDYGTKSFKNRIIFIALIIVFFFSAYLLLQKVSDPSYMMKFKGIILDKIVGQALLYSLIFLSGAMALLGVAGLISTFVDRKIVIGINSFQVPKNPLSRELVEIKYGQIISQKVERIGKSEILVIQHKSGRVKVIESALPSREAFETLCHAVRVKSDSC